MINGAQKWSVVAEKIKVRASLCRAVLLLALSAPEGAPAG
jgi:myo-inositol catabolism protein IolC